jgi:hypothetical protein
MGVVAAVAVAALVVHRPPSDRPAPLASARPHLPEVPVESPIAIVIVVVVATTAARRSDATTTTGISSGW